MQEEQRTTDKDGPPSGWDYKEGIPPGWETVSPEGRFPGMLLSGETMVSRPQGGVIVIRRRKEAEDE